MTENGICTMSRKDASAQDVAASDGYALPWVELKISEVEGLTTDDGQGLLWVKSASQCVDYLSDHEASRQRLMTMAGSTRATLRGCATTVHCALRVVSRTW